MFYHKNHKIVCSGIILKAKRLAQLAKQAKLAGSVIEHVYIVKCTEMNSEVHSGSMTTSDGN